jgi:aspartate 1-decarboxylase
MFAIINMNVKVDVVNKENAERLKTNASFPAPRTVTAHKVIAVVMGTA